MTAQEYAQAERDRRRRLAAIISIGYVVTDNPADRVRREEVVAWAQQALKLRSTDNSFRLRVRRAAEGMGAEAVTPHNARFFRKLRPRASWERPTI